MDRYLEQAKIDAEARGIKLTAKRAAVLKALIGMQKPVSAYDVVDQYREETGEKIAPMSAYRMLDLMVEAGVAHKLKSINKYVGCAHLCCDHDHGTSQFLICTDCEAVDETTLPAELLVQLQASVDPLNFSLHTNQLELHGRCGQCQ